ncbi:uncharacterized protein LOC133293507 [Gastrolobium bilobum]|uniref:uncharacterized protein LOC133293507 n=1 Tax=Gastrolobium bilobum TaxID=150636 RepID=UPI002AB2A26F|nr:uncharacterized protein LOC133293507 [Gastrolobium bilobum]
MAVLLRVQIAVLYGLLALSIAATARPCRTFLISSYSFSLAAEIFADRGHPIEIEGRPSPVINSFGLSAYDFSSLRDRTKDILSVVVALLFGVGCGAIIAATMYLLWSAFSSRYDHSGSYDEEDDKIESLKKTGYVKIPAKEASI